MDARGGGLPYVFGKAGQAGQCPQQHLQRGTSGSQRGRANPLSGIGATMAYGFVYAGDLARDLGFDGMTPAFWTWCSRHGIVGTAVGPFCFDPDDVKEAVARDRQAGTLPTAAQTARQARRRL